MNVHEFVDSPETGWGASRLLVEAAGDDRQSTLRVRGEVDISTADTFTDALRTALYQSTLQLSVDLSGVTFFGVAGLRALLRLRQEAESLATDLILLAPPDCVRHLMDITGTAAQFRLLDAQPREPAGVPTYRAVHL
jgi:anti-anti-sigma factor